MNIEDKEGPVVVVVVVVVVVARAVAPAMRLLRYIFALLLILGFLEAWEEYGEGAEEKRSLKERLSLLAKFFQALSSDLERVGTSRIDSFTADICGREEKGKGGCKNPKYIKYPNGIRRAILGDFTRHFHPFFL